MSSIADRQKAPCKNCTDRPQGAHRQACHDTCERFKIYKDMLEEQSRNTRRQKSLEHGANSSAICFSHRVVVGRNKRG